MTLAPARPMPAPPEPDGAEPTVTAVVISRRDPRGLADLLTAVLGQSLAPDAVLVLDRTNGAVLPADPAHAAGPADPHAGADLAEVVRTTRTSHPVPVTVRAVDPRTPVRAAAHRALLDAELDATATTLAWFLPVGTTPDVGALVALVDTWRRSPSTGLVGPKHVDADDPHVLRAMAIRSTRGGRLLSRPAPQEPDQGQYDLMTDALAVPFAGSLVERDLLVGLRGWEPSFGDVGADLDLGWRAHNAGRRVVVAPSARMRTAPGVAVAGASTATRRRASRRVALARAPWWAAPALALWIALTSVVVALALLLLKRPRAAWAELSTVGSLDPVRGTTARWRTRHRRQVGRRDLRSLFAPRRAVLTSWGDAVHDALVSPRPPMADESNDLSPRSWGVKVVRHPGVLAAVGAGVVAALAARTIGPGVVTGAGAGLTGGELVGTRADAGVLWSAWTDAWTGAGLGGPDPVGPSTALLAIPAWLVDHVPLVPSPASPAGLAVALLVLLGMPLAAVSAYLSFRVVAVTRWVRGLAAFAWATTGVAAATVAQGRLGALVALVLLPPLAAGLWLIATRRSTATSAFATSFAAVILGAFAPVLLGVVVVLALVLAVVRRGARRHGFVVALLPLALLAPWLVPAAEVSWPTLLAGAGLAQWGGTTPEPWQLALLHTGGPGSPVVWAGVPLLAVALLSLVRGRAWGSASTSLAVLAPVLLAAALVAPRVRLGTIPAGVEGAGEPITLWSGTMLLPFALALVLAGARGLDALAVRSAESATDLRLARPTEPDLDGSGAPGLDTLAARAAGQDRGEPDGIPVDADSLRPTGGTPTGDETIPSADANLADDEAVTSSADGVPGDAEPTTPVDGIQTSDAPGSSTADGSPAQADPVPPADGSQPDPRTSDDIAPERRGSGGRGRRVRRVALKGTVILAALAMVVFAAAVAWAGFGTALAPWRDPRPAVSIEQAEGAFATRTLFVSPGESGAGYRFVGREAADVVRPLPTVAVADGALATRISGVLGDASTAPSLFADTATDLLAVRSGIVPEVSRRLDATEGLQRIASRDGWEMWRVSPTAADDSLVAPPRLRMETPDGTSLVPTTGQHAGTETTVESSTPGTLVVAEPLDWSDHAVVAANGIRLAPLADTPTPAYALPAGTTRLSITVADSSRWWHVGQAVAFVVLAFLAVPFGRRESRVGRR